MQCRSAILGLPRIGMAAARPARQLPGHAAAKHHEVPAIITCQLTTDVCGPRAHVGHGAAPRSYLGRAAVLLASNAYLARSPPCAASAMSGASRDAPRVVTWPDCMSGGACPAASTGCIVAARVELSASPLAGVHAAAVCGVSRRWAASSDGRRTRSKP